MCFGLEFWMNFTEYRQHIKQRNNIDNHWLFHWCEKVRSKYGPLRGTMSYFPLRRVTTTTRNKLSSIRQIAPHPRQSCSAYTVCLQLVQKSSVIDNVKRYSKFKKRKYKPFFFVDSQFPWIDCSDRCSCSRRVFYEGTWSCWMRSLLWHKLVAPNSWKTLGFQGPRSGIGWGGGGFSPPTFLQEYKKI